MRGSTASRRVSEFVGVALFAAALIWIVSLASYDPGDPVWFFSTGSHDLAANFAGRVGAFLAELSFQLFGYASYVIPALLVVVGWHSFWCRSVDAAGNRAIGAALLLGCISAFLSLVFGTLEVSGRSFRAGGYLGEWLAKELAEYLNRTGSLIVIVTLIFLAIIMSTHFSFGRLFGALIDGAGHAATDALGSFRAWREERRREKQRRDVIAKHTKKGVPAPEVGVAPGAQVEAGAPRAARRQDADEKADAGSAAATARRSLAPPKPPNVSMPAPPLPLPDPEPIAKGPAARRKGD